MKITAVGPSSVCPFVPDYLVREDGALVWKGEQGTPGEPVPCPMEVPDGSWVGFPGDGYPHLFELSREGPWRASEASRCVQLAQRSARLDPLGAATMLRAAAQLVGLTVSTMIGALDAVRFPGESLEEAFTRVRSARG